MQSWHEARRAEVELIGDGTIAIVLGVVCAMRRQRS